MACRTSPGCDVPAGEFVMGSKDNVLAVYGGKETPQHSVELPAYRISKQPDHRGPVLRLRACRRLC